MTEPSRRSMNKASTSEETNPQHCTLHVCTSCRLPGTPRDPFGNHSGFIFYQQVRDEISGSVLRDLVEVRPAECLSVCPRPCGLALARPGAWTYLFGDQQPGETVLDILEGISLYIDSPDGFMARNERPESMRKSILGRVPPVKGVDKCT